MNKRHESILEIIGREKEVTVSELSRRLGVSLVTVRSDLRRLEEKKLLARTHGGASLPDSDDISHRLSINYSAKQRIARKAALQVEEGETILLEAGSCVALMARELANKSNINVITNNAFVARQLKGAALINVILMGGIYQKESETVVGPMIGEYLSYYNFSKVFLGMDGFTAERGAMCRDLHRAEVMARFVRSGAEVYILSDAAKLGVSAVRTFCPPDRMDCLITDDAIDPEFRKFFEESPVRLVVS